MSFSSDIKDELSRQVSSARHCSLAELSAIISYCGKLQINADGEYNINLNTENIVVARKYFTIIKKTFNIVTDISIKNNVYLKKSRTYTISIKSHKDVVNILQAVKVIDNQGKVSRDFLIQDTTILMNSCCKRAFLRGAFLAVGSISDPEKFYHLEFVTVNEKKALQIKNVIQSFQIEAKIIKRKNNFVVYIKESESIVELLNVMEAHVALMNFENIRILKQMRNSVNRKVNCETANINKTVSAALKHNEDINFIKNTAGLSILSEGLQEVAILRLENPDVSLKELGAMLDPPVGKSGVNHRLRKICDIADGLRDK